jgi:hypothetical protein
MKSFLARWRPGHVIAAWVAYWIGLAGVTLTPAILAIIRAASGPKDSGNVAASFNNTVLTITVTEFGKQTLAASASLLQIAFWVGVPPLALYAVWMLTRPRRPAPAPAALGEPGLDALPRPDVPQQAPSSSIHSRAPHA